MTWSPEKITIHSPIDVHVHLREPGTNKSETINSGTIAAYLGGYQAVFDMPNNPGRPTWDEERLKEKQAIGRRDSMVDIGFYAGIDLSDPDVDQIPRMIGRAAGLKLYMGHTTGNTVEHTLESARPIIDVWTEEARKRNLHAPILLHALGQVGAETVDYIVSNKKHHAHWCHLSSEYEASAAGLFTKYHGDRFTAGVTPHHLIMTKTNADQLGWAGGRMQPALRSETDKDALLRAFVDGDIQILETDHAPHSIIDKMKAEQENPRGDLDPGCTTCFGVSGIEHVLPIMAQQVRLGHLSMERLENSLYHQPLRMLGIRKELMKATTTLLMEPHRIEADDVKGASTNTPYINMMAGARIESIQNPPYPIRVLQAQKAA